MCTRVCVEARNKGRSFAGVRRTGEAVHGAGLASGLGGGVRSARPAAARQSGRGHPKTLADHFGELRPHSGRGALSARAHARKARRSFFFLLGAVSVVILKLVSFFVLLGDLTVPQLQQAQLSGSGGECSHVL